MRSNYVVSLKETRNPLEDILVPVEKRIGYIEGKTPVIPIYFYRLLGVEGNEENDLNIYKNELYRINEQLTQYGRYVRFDGPILTPQNNEMSYFKNFIGSSLTQDIAALKKQGLSLFFNSRIFYGHTHYPSIHRALQQVLELFLKNESFVNTSKMETFVVKMLIWLQRILPKLYSSNQISNDLPKILFYGDIKAHEIYFLIFLSLIGMDVLYIHTETAKEQRFSQIDPSNTFSKRMEYSNSFPLEPFPLEEKRVRKKTVTYEAKEEIESFLYGEDVGLFKTRQYEEGITKPITLRTTHDEMKILWHEEAKIRPEFRVENEIVFVPNLFVKVSGTYQILEEYWMELFELKNTVNMVFKEQVDFTPITYSRQEMYSTSFVLDENGLIDKEKLFKHPLYKLSYLNQSVQDLVVSKMNELIKSDMFLQEMTNDLRIKILMTIITMDKEFLRLVESFDFTGKVPKIVLYNNKPDNFTETDIILLCFFNLVGADIIIYTPTNYNNIEAWINSNYFDIHQLPSVQFDLEIPKELPKERTSFFKRFFKR
ncbi:YceG family protein [Ureibacillus sp. GCM10028918]|uniref:YceG family protein n=1 Tax=Ureibacillus sp. GCM10028918 TaxID=3273429 RepID=UPI003614B7C3